MILTTKQSVAYESCNLSAMTGDRQEAFDDLYSIVCEWPGVIAWDLLQYKELDNDISTQELEEGPAYSDGTDAEGFPGGDERMFPFIQPDNETEPRPPATAPTHDAPEQGVSSKWIHSDPLPFINVRTK
jgi:hypothetical protein